MATESGKMGARLGSAAAACEERLGDIGALLDLIGQELKGTRDNYSAEDGFDWELARDLGQVRARMVEALAAFAALSESEIEATLEEICSQREDK